MKKILSISVYFLVIALLVTSCSKDDAKVDEKITFDQTLLYGKWRSTEKIKPSPSAKEGYVFYVYTQDKKGYTWNEAETTEADAKKEGDEGQTFTWTLTANNLIEAHFGGKTQRSYVVKVLNKDYFENQDKSRTYRYNKVK